MSITRILAVADQRPPDFIVGGHADPYLQRWYLVPRNPVLNIYLHKFLRSDDDRAHHDHPWPSLSRCLLGELTEHTIASGGIHHRRRIVAGDWVLRSPWHAHRIEIAQPAWTLFITGPRIRTWGFHCESAGWIPWHRFVAEDPGAIGRGCDQ